MAKLKGTVRHLDLEGGLWVLEADDGRRYQLEGGDGGLRSEGQRVTVEGDVDEGAFTIGMTGPVLSVRRYHLG